MRFTLFSPRYFVAALALSAITIGQAQEQSSTVGTLSAARADAALTMPLKSPVEQRTEHLLVEDGGAVVDEVRVGGQSRSISVLPKGGLPAYQVAPGSGERSWKILGF